MVNLFGDNFKEYDFKSLIKQYPMVEDMSSELKNVNKFFVSEYDPDIESKFSSIGIHYYDPKNSTYFNRIIIKKSLGRRFYSINSVS